MRISNEFPRDDRFMSPMHDTTAPALLVFAAFLTGVTVTMVIAYACAGPWLFTNTALQSEWGLAEP